MKVIYLRGAAWGVGVGKVGMGEPHNQPPPPLTCNPLPDPSKMYPPLDLKGGMEERIGLTSLFPDGERNS